MLIFILYYKELMVEINVITTKRALSHSVNWWSPINNDSVIDFNAD
jgi:hypothetical protein